MFLSKILFLLSLALIPIQLNKFFFNSHSLVLGVPIDYLAPSVYLSDIVITLSIVSFFFTNKKNLKKILNENKSIVWAMVLFAFFLLVSSVFFSSDQITSLIFNLKILEAMLFSIVCLYYFKIQKMKLATNLIFSTTILLEGILAIAQFTLQRSFGLYFLGERTFDVTTSQVATTNILGLHLLRSYGTFPHPNVLAAFLVVLLVISTQTRSLKKSKIEQAVLLITPFALMTTFSKTGLALFLLYIILFYLKSIPKILTISALAFLAVLYLVFFSQTYIDSLAERILLAQAALTVSIGSPFMGIGSANFIRSLADLNIMSLGQVRLLQPVHNVFLLILVENGIIGLMLFASVIFIAINRAKNISSLFLSLALLSYLTVDHFLWTLHQGQLLLFITLILIYNSKKPKQADIFI